jgi:glutamyl-tRNA reductase
MQRLLLLGLNHMTAPIEVREKLALNADRHREAVDAFRQHFAGSEVVLLSTCNRVELYAAREVHGHPRAEELISFLAEFQRIPEASFRDHVYQKSDRDVVEHLFAVASSLDSMVLGETQILGQVRNAYDASVKLAATGPALNPLFQRAIAVGRQVMTSTTLNEGRLSVASVAVDHARQVFETFADKTVLAIGAGKIAATVLKHFAELKPGKLLICNRDATKAARLAGGYGGLAVPWEGLDDHLVQADVVISSTGAPHAIVTAARFNALRKKRKYRPIFMIDIAVPRDIEPAVAAIDGVFLYNVDDLQRVVAATHANRSGAIDAARGIVCKSVDEFLVWHRTREMGPVIDQLYQKSHALAAEEVVRVLGKLPNVSADERQHLEDLARRIVNKLLHDPITTLRDADSAHAPGGQYLHAMQKLFQLKDEPPKDEP